MDFFDYIACVALGVAIPCFFLMMTHERRLNRMTRGYPIPPPIRVPLTADQIKRIQNAGMSGHALGSQMAAAIRENVVGPRHAISDLLRDDSSAPDNTMKPSIEAINQAFYGQDDD